MTRYALGGLVAALAWTAATFPVLAAPHNGDVSVELDERTPGLTPELFRSTLRAHGDWYASPRYGEVWRPRVAVGWRPYYYGSWLWTDEGWYWDSDEPFAWAVYHYGRWVWEPAWGWVWVPGYVWAPAWVTWRFGIDAIGWAPLGPGVSVYVTSYPFVDFWWTFVPTVQFVGVPVHRVAYPPREVHRWFRATAPAPPRASPAPPRDGRVAAAPAWGGPARHFVEERTGRAIVPERRAPSVRPEPGRPAAREPPIARPPAPEGPGRGERAPRAVPREERWERQERERPDVRPAPRQDRGRPDIRPAPRQERERPEVRPEVRPAPRQDGGRSPARAAPDRGGDRGERGR